MIVMYRNELTFSSISTAALLVCFPLSRSMLLSPHLFRPSDVCRGQDLPIFDCPWKSIGISRGASIPTVFNALHP